MPKVSYENTDTVVHEWHGYQVSKPQKEKEKTKKNPKVLSYRQVNENNEVDV